MIIISSQVSRIEREDPKLDLTAKFEKSLEQKGVAHYEEEVCQYATMDDLDAELLDSYRQKI